jgi:hypothetical protein
MDTHHPAAHIFYDHLMHGFSLVASVFVVLAVDQAIASLGARVGSDVLWLGAFVIVIPVLLVLVPVYALFFSLTPDHVELERRLRSPAMRARVGNDGALLQRLNDERVRRIDVRFRYIHRFAFSLLFSPIGALARLVDYFRRRTSEIDTEP